MLFLKNHTQNVVEILFPDTFLDTKNWANLWINSLIFCTVCFFYCMPSWVLSKYIKTKLQNICFSLYKTFLKNKKTSGTSLPASFFAWFLQQDFSLVIFFYLTKFHCLFLLYNNVFTKTNTTKNTFNSAPIAIVWIVAGENYANKKINK